MLSIKTKLQQNPNQKKTNEGNSNYDLNVQYQYLCLVAQLCLTLCDPMDCSLPGFSVRGILQARILEQVPHFLLPGIFTAQKSKSDLPHCKQTCYHLSHCLATREASVITSSFSNQIFSSCIQDNLSYCSIIGFLFN